MKQLPKLIVIVGPTASGKSDLGIKLAKKWNGEIISADSRQIYRGMDIGTAKPPKDRNYELGIRNYVSGGIRHHLIDIRNPDEEYSAAQFKIDVLRAIKEILRRGKPPILVGGTGLYIKTVADNLDIPRVRPNQKMRAELEEELRRRGIAHLYKKLVALDPEAAYIVDPKNPRRVIRALEIIAGTKKLFSEQRTQGERLFDVLKIGIELPANELKHRIDERVEEMTNDGLIDEVKNLLKRYKATTHPFDAIGYREIISHLNGEITRDAAIALMKANTWQFARRQMTWFRADKEIRWVNKESVAEELVGRFIR